MREPESTRRRILHGAGISGTGLIAGCFGSDDDQQPPDDDDEDDSSDSDDTGGADESADTDESSGDGTVHFITDYYTDSWEALWDDLESTFEDETGIQIDIEEGGMSGTHEGRLARLIQAGNPPDANTSTFDQVADIWATDQLETVTEVVSSIEAINGETNTDAFLGEGDEISQIPHGLSVSNFQYRADVYDALDLEEPETFSDVLENAQVIDEDDEYFPDMRGYGLAGAPTGKSQDEFLVMLASAGIPGIGLRWQDPDVRDELEIHWPEDVVTEVLQYIKDLAQYSPNPTSIGWAESLSQWVQGQYAQCYHLNAWPAGITAQVAEAENSDALGHVAESTQIIPYPMLDGVDPDENWLSSPAPDGYHVFSGGDDTEEAKEWFEWLYADSMERTVSLYETDPGRFLPAYADVLESDEFRNRDIFRTQPHLLEKLEYVQDEIRGNHYGSVDEADISSPEALYMQRQWFYGAMVNRVVIASMTPQEAYDWGYEQLEDAFADAQERFGD